MIFAPQISASLLTAVCAGFLPPNDLQIPITKRSGLSEVQYHSVIDKVEKVYAPVARSYGSELKIERMWESPVVNAGSIRDEGGKHWHIKLYGGLPRHPSITEDGFALVICHEIGHQIGGAPKKVPPSPVWSSAEGQSDYWGTLKCLRRVFDGDDNISRMRQTTMPQVVLKACKEAFKLDKNVALCLRTSMAGLSVSTLQSRTLPSYAPEFESPDQTVVEATNERHPSAQCRLDSYFNGSLCPIVWKETVSQKEELKGVCHPHKGYQVGIRPGCWYKTN